MNEFVIDKEPVKTNFSNQDRFDESGKGSIREKHISISKKSAPNPSINCRLCVPTDRLSTTLTFASSEINSSTRLLPMNPAPPVTRQVLSAK